MLKLSRLSGTVPTPIMTDSDDPMVSHNTGPDDGIVNPDKPLGYQRKTHPLFIEPETIGTTVDFQAIFGNDHPVELEVGSERTLKMA